MAERYATLAEIRSSWTIEEVATANDMLDYQAAQQAEASAPRHADDVDPQVAALIGRKPKR